MQVPDPVETIMARLMPSALSGERQFEIETLIEDLAGPGEIVPISRGKWSVRVAIGGGIAAAIGGLCALIPTTGGSSDRGTVVATPPVSSGYVLVSESDRVESVTDEGWREDANGSAVRALRMSVVGENRVRDEETGMIVRISEPREEILLMPVSSF